jgi:hypothetical protein
MPVSAKKLVFRDWPGSRKNKQCSRAVGIPFHGSLRLQTSRDDAEARRPTTASWFFRRTRRVVGFAKMFDGED